MSQDRVLRDVYFKACVVGKMDGEASYHLIQEGLAIMASMEREGLSFALLLSPDSADEVTFSLENGVGFDEHCRRWMARFQVQPKWTSSAPRNAFIRAVQLRAHAGEHIFNAISEALAMRRAQKPPEYAYYLFFNDIELHINTSLDEEGLYKVFQKQQEEARCLYRAKQEETRRKDAADAASDSHGGRKYDPATMTMLASALSAPSPEPAPSGSFTAQVTKLMTTADLQARLVIAASEMSRLDARMYHAEIALASCRVAAKTGVVNEALLTENEALGTSKLAAEAYRCVVELYRNHAQLQDELQAARGMVTETAKLHEEIHDLEELASEYEMVKSRIYEIAEFSMHDHDKVAAALNSLAFRISSAETKRALSTIGRKIAEAKAAKKED